MVSVVVRDLLVLLSTRCCHLLLPVTRQDFWSTDMSEKPLDVIQPFNISFHRSPAMFSNK